MMFMMRFLSSMLDRLFVIAGALLGVQIPLFMQQYTQRLAGHVAELNHILNGLREMAFQSNKTLDQYIAKFLASPDQDFSRQGEFMLGIVTRWQHLSEALENMTASSILMRPYVFLRDLQYDIAKPVFYSFEPGLNLTTEGFCYGLAGAVLGYGLYWVFCKTLRRLMRVCSGNLTINALKTKKTG